MKPSFLAKAALSVLIASSLPAQSALDKNAAISANEQNGPMVRFESPEHQTIGADVLIKMPGPLDDPANVQAKRGDTVWVKSYQGPSSTQRLYFSDIVWLSGDLMGEPNQSIGLSKTPEATLDMNLAAYEKYSQYLPEVMNVFREMRNALQAQINAGQTLDTSGFDAKFNSATGGWGGFAFFLSKGLYLELADSNYDHFGDQAVKAYLTAHEKALKLASKANSPDDLRNAYFVEAYGDHFLTDLFASGHLRVPRAEMARICTGSITTSLMAKGMHDEDGDNGLTLRNGKGETWFAKGDRKYYTSENSDDRRRVVAVVQKSVDQVYAAYLNRTVDVSVENAKMLREIPDIEQVRINNDKTSPPLYRVVTSGGKQTVEKRGASLFSKYGQVCF